MYVGAGNIPAYISLRNCYFPNGTYFLAVAAATTVENLYIDACNEGTSAHGVSIPYVASGCELKLGLSLKLALGFSQANYIRGAKAKWTIATELGGSVYEDTLGGGLIACGTSGIGYGTTAGGTVTQLTSRTTGVTLNALTGAITMFSAPGSATPAAFTVANSAVAATDIIIVNQKSGTNQYVLSVTGVSAGGFNITFYTTGGTATDAPVINFAVIKG